MNLKIFFTWWNRQTFGTFLKTLFFGKYMGKDEFGNKYYKNKEQKKPKDMLLIGGIKQLLHIEGHTIKGAKQVLREKGLNYVVGLSKPIISEEYVEAVNAEKANEEVTKTSVKSHKEKQTSLKTQKNNSSNQKVPDQPGLFDFFDTENPNNCLLYTSPSPRDTSASRVPAWG